MDDGTPKEVSWFISDNVSDQDDTDRIIHGYRHLQYNPSFDSAQDSAHQVLFYFILSTITLFCFVFFFLSQFALILLIVGGGLGATASSAGFGA
jgi:hypothetical protein